MINPCNGCNCRYPGCSCANEREYKEYRKIVMENRVKYSESSYTIIESVGRIRKK